VERENTRNRGAWSIGIKPRVKEALFLSLKTRVLKANSSLTPRIYKKGERIFFLLG